MTNNPQNLVNQAEALEEQPLRRGESPASIAPTEPLPATVWVRPRAVAGFLALVIAGFVLAHLVGQFAKYRLDRDHLLGFVPLFDLDGEGNIPVWYASAALLVACLLLGFVARLKRTTKDSYWLYWAGLCVVFLLLSVDEMVGLHERLSGLISSFVDTSGLFLFAWTIPATVAVMLLGLVYLRFLLHLPALTRNLFILAGLLFVTGALAMEMVEGQFVTVFGPNNLSHSLLVAAEECLEMSGVALFICALIGYTKREYPVLQLRFGRESDGSR